jgi:hypothetical protein
MSRRRAVLLLVLAACTDKSKNESAPATPPPEATASASAVPTTTTRPEGPQDKAPEVAIPPNEIVPGSFVVDGDLFRYQVPVGFKPHGKDGWQGAVGLGGSDDAVITISASSRKFKGDIDALVASETKDATERGAKIELAGPVLVWVAGKVDPTRGRRLLARFSDRLDYRVLVVRAPNAFVLHCETADTPSGGGDAWKNVGASCMARGNTFHIAPLARGS